VLVSTPRKMSNIVTVRQAPSTEVSSKTSERTQRLILMLSKTSLIVEEDEVKAEVKWFEFRLPDPSKSV
jgi:hypothetical protein